MQGHKQFTDTVVLRFRLLERVPKQRLYRRLAEHCNLRLDILYFLGYEVDEGLPWHSTISRTRQPLPAAVYKHLFEHVFAQCVAAGLVTGHTQAVGSAFVKANALFECLGAFRALPLSKIPVHLPQGS